MAIIYSKQTGEAHEVSDDLAMELLLGTWAKGVEFYSPNPVPVPEAK